MGTARDPVSNPNPLPRPAMRPNAVGGGQPERRAAGEQQRVQLRDQMARVERIELARARGHAEHLDGATKRT